MSTENETDTAQEPGPLTLDPFSFHGHPTSCIEGLGGNAPLPDPTYAFHTNYVAVARGRAHFTVRFQGLQAKQGTLWLRIHMLVAKPGAVARMVTSERVQFNRLAQIGGEISLRFEAFRGATYAILGVVSESTDARAEALTVTLDRPGDPSEWGEAADVDEASETAFGTEALRAPGLLLSLDPPLLAAPVSQPCTPKQLREASFIDWCRRLDWDQDADAWQLAYVLQALSTYGMLQPGARGVCLGATSHALAAPLELAGLETTLVRFPGEQSSPDGDRLVQEIEPAAIAESLIAFDFLCSIRIAERFETAAEGAAFIERMMESLRPGGLAVHVIGYQPSLMSDPCPGPVFNRAAVERLGLSLVSRGHDVARIKLALDSNLVQAAGPDGIPAVPFGIVARRARLIL